jgi:hypothetical protein
MKKFLIMAAASAMAVAAATPADAAITISYSINGGAVTTLATDAGTPGSAGFVGNAGGYFFNVGATGFPIALQPDFLTQSLNIQSGQNNTPATLNVYITQTGLNPYTGPLISTFTSNTLTGAASSARVTSLVNATQLQTNLFTGPGTFTGGNNISQAAPFSQTVRYDIAFTGTGPGTFNGTGNLTAVPEPATWAMMIMGFGLVGGVMRRRSTKVAFA